MLGAFKTLMGFPPESEGALFEHRLVDLQESGDVGAGDEVVGPGVFHGGFVGLLEDVGHDLVQFRVDFFEGPVQMHRVLRHFQTGDGDAAGVGGLAGGEQDAMVDEVLGRVVRRRHVRAFDDHPAAVLDEFLGALEIDFILRRARHGDIARNVPNRLGIGIELRFRMGQAVLVHHDGVGLGKVLEEFEIHSVLVVDDARHVGHGDDLRTELGGFQGSHPADFAGTADDDAFVPEGIVAIGPEHFLGEVADAVAGRLAASERSAGGDALGSEDAVPLAVHLLVEAEHVADLAGTDAEITGGDVFVGTDVLPEFGHEGLAEGHDFLVGLAGRVEVGAAFGAAHRKTGQRVLEGLFEAEELADGFIDVRGEADAALVGADRRVELDAHGSGDLDDALVVGPGDAELDDAFRFDDAFHDREFLDVGFFFDQGIHRSEELFDRLEEFRLIVIPLA